MSVWLNIILAGLICTTVLSQEAWAQANFPAKPVTLVLPTAPGGPTDREARFYVQKLYENTGQPFILDFKAGARAQIGNLFVVKAPPDGYTLLLSSSGLPVIPAFTEDMPYDTIKDFAPVMLVSKRHTALLVHPSLPVNTLQEYIAFAKANPGKLNYATASAGSITHLAAAWLESVTGAKVTLVHYKGGGPMVLDLVGGRVDVAGSPVSNTLALMRAGKLRAIAILSNSRIPQLPDIRTVAEQGFPEYDYPGWMGLLAPAKTPGAIINKLNTEFARAVKSPDVVKTLEADGVSAIASSPEAFGRLLVSELARWKKIARDNNIKSEE